MGKNIGLIHIEPPLGLVGLERMTFENIWNYCFMYVIIHPRR